MTVNLSRVASRHAILHAHLEDDLMSRNIRNIWLIAEVCLRDEPSDDRRARRKCQATSEIFVAWRSSFHVVIIVVFDPCRYVLEGGNRILASYVAAKDRHTNCNCSSKKEKP